MHAEFPALPLTLLRHLTLDPAQHPRALAHLSAASGLVHLGPRLYVVADDEMHLGVFGDGSTPGAHQVPGTLVRLLKGDLPGDKSQRKKAKPDLETLALLPPLPGYPCGALLALGSGSKPQREAGVLVALDAHGLPDGRPCTLDLAPLYAPLRTHFADLNIEGAFVCGAELLLLQRGNKVDALSASIHFDWHPTAAWLAGQQTPVPRPRRVQPLALGDAEGVPLALTDGTPLQGGAWAFSAVAEDTNNSYHDGGCVASAIGIVGADGRLRHLQRLQGAPKVEGIAAQAVDGGWQFTLVTDPDAPHSAAQLLQARIAQQD